MNREKMALELVDVYKSFQHNGNRIDVLKGININVESGNSIAILGVSGAGKSTLLNIMGMLEAPSKGIVRFNGHESDKMSEQELCRLKNLEIGFIFQFHHLLSEFNAIENTMIPALIARKTSSWAMEKAKTILTRVGLKKRMTHRIGELSGGEQQRVAIARALVMKPTLLLADEPTGNLDRKTGEEIVELLLHLKQEDGLSMIIATHNQQLAKNMTHKMEIVDGQIL